MREIGRPRTMEVLRHGDVIELIRVAGGEPVGRESYLVVINGNETWLTSESSDDLLLNRVNHGLDAGDA